MRLAVLASLAVAILGSAAVALIVSADPGAEPCVEPRILFESSYNAAAQAADQYIEVEANAWDVVQDPAKVTYSAEFDPEYVKTALAAGAPPGDRLVFEGKLIYDGHFGFGGEVVAAKAWRQYRIVVSRDCAGGDWNVDAELVKEGSVDGPRARGPVGVPDNQAS